MTNDQKFDISRRVALALKDSSEAISMPSSYRYIHYFSGLKLYDTLFYTIPVIFHISRKHNCGNWQSGKFSTN